MEWKQKISQVQGLLREYGLQGWLLYDFRRNNDLACRFLEIPTQQLLTRRYFYWIPQTGNPVKLVHGVEEKVLEHLPGTTQTYRTWQELEALLASMVAHSTGVIPQGTPKVAMEYSPRNALPYISKVDGGTLDLIRSLGVDVVSSANLLQNTMNILTQEQIDSHLEAAEILDRLVGEAWELVGKSLREKKEITEATVQQFILEQFAKSGCVSAGFPICAVNAHSSNPHYRGEEDSKIQPGDFILIDLWAKKLTPEAIYADITRVGVAAAQPTEEQQKVFTLVKKARDAGIALVQERFQQGKMLQGWEVDRACRTVIDQAGYGEYFVHRTGHNIGTEDHGSGAHIDDYETHDDRTLLPGTCFSIEPGIYLPGKFGVRLELDVLIHLDGSVQVTGGVQDSVTCMV